MSVQHCGSEGDPLEFTVMHLFCGSGGGALGFQRARAKWQSMHARFRTLGGIDVDPQACVDFERLVGVRPTCMDLFAREDYISFHGHEPPSSWREATPEDLRAAAGGERPDVVFQSSPCKGLSALLPGKQASSPKYAALNRLTVRGIRLTLEAWAADLPGLVLFENVPRITSSRGSSLLTEIKRLLRGAGYLIHDGTHDMGEVGGLAQHRRRYLLVARHPDKVPPLVFRPQLRKVRAIGEVLEALPMPDDPQGGDMHRMPRLQWRTWARLAYIPAGGDWRDLEGASAYRIEPGACPHYNHVMRVTSWGEASGAVTGGGRPAQGAICVADPRLEAVPVGHAMRPVAWDQAAGTVTAARSPAYGAIAAADPRLPGQHWDGHYRVVRYDEPARTVTASSSSFGSNAGMAVADPRLGYRPRRGSYKVARYDEPASTITASAVRPGASNGVAAVADPRVPKRGANFKGSPGLQGVIPWSEPSKAVTGSASVSRSNMAAAVVDPRLGCTPRNGAYRVCAWDEPASTVTAAGDVHSQGASAVADPRLPTDTENGVWVIVALDGTWHRPLTTYELAQLQGFPPEIQARDDLGRPLIGVNGQPIMVPLLLAGRSHSAWRERIGNAVPPAAAEAMAMVMGEALIAAREGYSFTFNLRHTPVWVREALDRLVHLPLGPASVRASALASDNGLGG